MAREKRLIDDKEVEVDVEVVDGKEVVTQVKKEGFKGPVDQSSIDRIWKQSKETEEKLTKQLNDATQANVDLVGRVKKLEEGKEPKKPVDEEKPPQYGQQANGTWAFPQTKEAWDDLFTDDPTFATDLRQTYNTMGQKSVDETIEAQRLSAINVAENILPDMYMHDKDGKLLLDEHKHPIPNEKSEILTKFLEVARRSGTDANGNPLILKTKDGPEMVALKVTRELGISSEAKLKTQAEKEADEKEKERLSRVKGGGLAPKGGTPPPDKEIEIKWHSDAEKKMVEAKIAQGKYKDAKEYMMIRDNKNIPYNRGV